MGISGLERLSGSRLTDYYIAVGIMLALGTIMWKITQSNTGLIFHAIREDELAVRTAGINTTRYKLLAFCLSGFFAGISGGLYAHFMRIAGPANLEVSMSFTVVIWAIFGGVVTIYGPIGAVFILYSPDGVLPLLARVSHVDIRARHLVDPSLHAGGPSPLGTRQDRNGVSQVQDQKRGHPKDLPHLYSAVRLERETNDTGSGIQHSRIKIQKGAKCPVSRIGVPAFMPAEHQKPL